MTLNSKAKRSKSDSQKLHRNRRSHVPRQNAYRTAADRFCPASPSRPGLVASDPDTPLKKAELRNLGDKAKKLPWLIAINRKQASRRE